MSASKELKEAGVQGGVRQASKITGRAESTLNDWYHKDHKLFIVIKEGCAAIIRSKNMDK